MTDPASGAKPLVTLGVPVFNGEQFLSQTIVSLQLQDYQAVEILISDNGSTDATEAICRAAARADPRIRYLRAQYNHGGAWNFNELITHARGAYFKFAAADDLVEPSFVSACVNALEGSSESVLAFPRTRIIDSQGTVIEELNDGDLVIDQQSPHERIGRFFRAQASHIVYGLVRTDVLRTTRGIRPVVGDDFVLMVELACRGSFTLVPERLFLQRRHSSQYSVRGAGQLEWAAPDRSVRFAFPQTVFNIDILRAIIVAPIAWPEKVHCAVVTLRTWVLPRWRAMASDVRLAVIGTRRGRDW